MEETQHDFVERAMLVSDAGVDLASAKSIETSVIDVVARGGLVEMVTDVVQHAVNVHASGPGGRNSSSRSRLDMQCRETRPICTPLTS